MSYAGPWDYYASVLTTSRKPSKDLVVEGFSPPSIVGLTRGVDQPHVRSDACQESEQRNSRNHGLLSRFLLCNCSYAIALMQFLEIPIPAAFQSHHFGEICEKKIILPHNVV